MNEDVKLVYIIMLSDNDNYNWQSIRFNDKSRASSGFKVLGRIGRAKELLKGLANG